MSVLLEKAKEEIGKAKDGATRTRDELGRRMPGRRNPVEKAEGRARRAASALRSSARQVREGAEDRVRARQRGERRRRRKRAGAAAAAGAAGGAGAYFLDPNSGGRRRQAARAKALKLLRRGEDRNGSAARNGAGGGEVIAAAAGKPPETRAPGDEALADRGRR